MIGVMLFLTTSATLILALVMVLLNRRVQRLERGASTSMCPHAWGVWEPCVVIGYEWLDGKKTRVDGPGQRRDCTMCGERQAREVTAT